MRASETAPEITLPEHQHRTVLAVLESFRTDVLSASRFLFALLRQDLG